MPRKSVLTNISRENISYRDYPWRQVLLGLLIGSLYELLIFCLRPTMRVQKITGADAIPRNAIVLLYHPDVIFFPLTFKVWGTLSQKFIWVGLHHWTSYWGSIALYIKRFPAVRFSRADKEKPFRRIVEFINRYPDLPFAIRTDSGGPYLRVRHSAVTLATATKRPVVCVRQIGSWVITFPNKHAIPLPGSKIFTYVSEPISCEKLAAMPIDDARDLLEEMMDHLPLST